MSTVSLISIGLWRLEPEITDTIHKKLVEIGFVYCDGSIVIIEPEKAGSDYKGWPTGMRPAINSSRRLGLVNESGEIKPP